MLHLRGRHFFLIVDLSRKVRTTGAGNGGQITISRRETRALTPIAGRLRAAFAGRQAGRQAAMVRLRHFAH